MSVETDMTDDRSAGHRETPSKKHITGAAQKEIEARSMTGLIEREAEHRRRAEAALLECESSFRRLLDHVPSGIFELEIPTAKLINVNECVVQALCYSKEKLLSMTLPDLLEDESRLLFRERYTKLLSGEIMGESVGEYKIITADARVHSALMRTHIIYEKGKPHKGITVSHDTTELKRLESELYESQKMEAIGTLAGGIAHDFNNLLMIIQGSVSLMMDQKMPLDPDYRLLTQIDKASKTGARLARMLLGYAGKGNYRIETIDLNQLVNDAAKILGRTRKDIVCHTDLSGELWSIKADKGQIEQVLLNLIANAFEAMPGGGELKLRSQNVPADEVEGFVSKAARCDYVLLEVLDTGIGMDEQTIKRIFDPYFTTKEMGRGVGLGLASVSGIVGSHRGYIRVSSQKEKGTMFRILIPAHESLRSCEDKKMITHTTVLVVDDENFVLEIVTEMLKRIGCTVIPAKNGQAAIDLFIQNREMIDMVMLDMVMPGIGAGQVLSTIKQIRPEIKVILTSGFSESKIEDTFLLKGVNGFLGKPYRLNELSKMIQRIAESGSA